MSAVQIPNLTPAIAATRADMVEAVQAGSSVRMTLGQIVDLAGTGGGSGGGDDILYIIPEDDMSSPYAAIMAALSEYDRVMVPGGNWTVNTSMTVASGKTLIGAPGCNILTSVAEIFTLTSASNFSISNITIIGPDSGTSYQIVMTDCSYASIDISIRNGNSGINLIRSDRNKIRLDASEMRANGIKLTGSQFNEITLVNGRNVSGFGVYAERPTAENPRNSTGNSIYSEKYCDPANLTSWQSGNPSSSRYDAANGRIGLEGIGLTRALDPLYGSNGGNHIVGCVIKDSSDNGVSITSDGNTGSNLIIDNCDHDGLHLYGSSNAFSSVVSTRNRFSGLGISQSETTGEASFNTVVGLVSTDNERYGVEFKDIANGNFVISALDGNILGPSEDSSSGANSLGLAGGVPVSSASAQVSFVGVSDLSPSYGVRTAYFRHADYYCDFWLSLRITPTYTVPGSPGEFRISVPGLPTANLTPAMLVSAVSGLTWPSGASQLSARFESGSVIRIRAQGPTLNEIALTSSNFPVGQQVSLTISGRYQTVEAGGAGGGGGGGGSPTWGDITGTLSAQTDLQAALDAKASTTELALKANITDVLDGLATKADTTALAGYQPLAAVLTGTTASFTTAQETKLAGIATAATANATDAFLLDRANHTGTQAAGTITGLAAVATSGAFADIGAKPTTLAGYGITDAAELPFIMPPSGEWVATVSGGFALGSNLGMFTGSHCQFPFIARRDMSVTEVAINVAAAASAGNTCKVTIYDADADGRPRNLLIETATMPDDSTGIKSVACVLSLLKGAVYWIGLRTSGGGPSFSSWSQSVVPCINGGTSPNINPKSSLFRTTTYASPTQNPWVWTPSEISVSSPPAVWIKV